MDVFVARFPVFDGGKNVSLYELSFRPGYDQACRQASKGNDEGLLARINFDELSGGKKALVNFSRELLLADFPQLFPPDAMVPCIDGQLGADAEVVARCKQLRERGYLLAVDNFTPAMLKGPWTYLANAVRVSIAHRTLEEQQMICEQCRSRQIIVVAQDVDSQEQFAQASQMGYVLFQGQFFSRPDTSVMGELGHNKLICLRLMKEVNQQPFSYDMVASLIEQDVGMTYKLMRLINSAWFGLRYEVRSIRHALVLLGPREVQRWASLVALNQAGDDKPPELLMLALTRAKFAEALAELGGMKKHAPELFLLGMFSVLDALMDRPMEDMLAEVPLSKDIKTALLTGGGQYGQIFQVMLAYEHAQWVLFADLASSLNIPEAPAAGAFRQALAWSARALQTEVPAES